MDEQQKALYREAYKKGLSDGMKQFARILTSSITQLVQNNVDSIVENMLEQQRLLAEAQTKAAEEAESKKQSAFTDIAAPDSLEKVGE